MPKRPQSAPRAIEVDAFLFDAERASGDEQSWFVYLFALADCSAFKVGFTCNPLQRIFTFSRRYFEYFDLRQSILLELPDCDAARALEAELKQTFAADRAQAPTWVPALAGGHTEWFAAVHFSAAEARLRSIVAAHDRVRVTSAFDLFRAELERASASFETWAYGQAQRACEAWSSAQRGYAVRDRGGSLRDWLDAYRYFDLRLFADEPQVHAFVRDSARGATF